MYETFKRQRSRLAITSLVGCYGLVLCAIFCAFLPFWMRFLIAVPLLIDAIWLIAKEGYLCGTKAVLTLAVNQQYWLLTERSGREIRGELIQPAFTSSWFSILRLRLLDGKCYNLVIFCDGLCHETYRRLVIHLKYPKMRK